MTTKDKFVTAIMLILLVWGDQVVRPSTVVSGQNLNAGHFSHPTAMAMGQIVMWFTPFNKELER
ncbi:uncharacterized protein METZ01_LOCUS358205, partial [marine metagenome]